VGLGALGVTLLLSGLIGSFVEALLVLLFFVGLLLVRRSLLVSVSSPARPQRSPTTAVASATVSSRSPPRCW
jgi:hypothetical protein